MNLKGKPFYLSEGDINWVNTTRDSMTLDEKVGQLFCMVSYSDNEALLNKILNDIKPGGLMCRPMPVEESVNAVNHLQKNSRIPLLIAANLESGANGVAQEGTKLGSPLQIGATDNVEMARKLGTVCGEAGAAAGVNWSFAPIVDIDVNFRNPITNTRTFGSDKERVEAMGKAYIEEIQGHGLAASAKHFPGDGIDERDQHLVTSVNDLSVEEWNASFGKIYKTCIETGVKSVMIGHISLPNYEKHVNPAIKDEDIMPASLSKTVVTGLLREELGFDGLIVTDATSMAGMTIPMPRSKSVPYSIACGNDMFLFTRDMDEDFGFMKAGVESGIITPERLDEAITRILAMKASLKLHEQKANDTLLRCPDKALETVKSEQHKVWAQECADQAITLVKQEKGVLPLCPKKHKRILFYALEAGEGFAYGVKQGVCENVKQRLIAEGFEVDQFSKEQAFEGMMRSDAAIVGKYDAIVYVANLATKSNQTTIRIEWELPMGVNVPQYIESVPTVFISVENPYHLLDVPRVKTFINCYSSTDQVLESLIEKLMGRSPFKGISPVDPFVGRWDTRL